MTEDEITTALAGAVRALDGMPSAAAEDACRRAARELHPDAAKPRLRLELGLLAGLALAQGAGDGRAVFAAAGPGDLPLIYIRRPGAATAEDHARLAGVLRAILSPQPAGATPAQAPEPETEAETETETEDLRARLARYDTVAMYAARLLFHTSRHDRDITELHDAGKLREALNALDTDAPEGWE